MIEKVVENDRGWDKVMERIVDGREGGGGFLMVRKGSRGFF